MQLNSQIVLEPSVTCYFFCLYLVRCWSFMSWHNLRSCQNSYRLMTERPRGARIVLVHWATKPPALWLEIIFSQIILILSPCPLLIVLDLKRSTWLGINKSQFLRHWFDLTRVLTCASQVGTCPVMNLQVLITWPTKISDGRSTHAVWFFASWSPSWP